MKKIILSALLIAVFASCKKLNDVLPESNISEPGNTITVPTAEEGKLLASIKVTPAIQDDAGAQIVKASVNDKTLTLAYSQRVHVLADKERYESAWHVYFNEDFKNTQLDGLDFRMKMGWGETVFNWKPNDMDQIEKTMTDTVIGGVKVLNIRFERTYNFFKEYNTPEEATAKMEAVVGKKEKLRLLTRYEPDTDSTRFFVSTVDLQYTK
ncbi:MAG: hypothetical protein EOP46_14965 [Sphingobacteriaceae bacterium]|nr:MAG: hypothetical protein EOP46_14965 [Sphingobacteriaceae bacterium]